MALEDKDRDPSNDVPQSRYWIRLAGTLGISGLFLAPMFTVFRTHNFDWTMHSLPPLILVLLALAAALFLLIGFLVTITLEKAFSRKSAANMLAEMSGQKLFAQKKARPASALMPLIMFGLAGALFAFITCTDPLRTFETFILAALIASPFVFGLGMLVLQGNPDWPFLPVDSGDADSYPPVSSNALWIFRVQLGLAACVIGASLLLVLNEKLDYSPASQQSFVITNKYTTYNKGREYYHLQFTSPAPSPVSVLEFGGKEKLDVQYDTYRAVFPGLTRVNMNIHPGFFHWPWYEPYYSFTTNSH